MIGLTTIGFGLLGIALFMINEIKDPIELIEWTIIEQNTNI